jgi:hypothetical protein
LSEQIDQLGSITGEQEFFKAVSEDLKQSLVLFLCERGHGKSSSLKAIIKYCKETNSDIIVKCFDPSMSWYEISPTKYRQYVSTEKLTTGMIDNVGDCTYEIGSLTEEQRRFFLGTCIAQDYKYRYNLRLNDPAAFKKLPWVIYVIEESNTIFGSFSFRKNDAITPVLQDFVSIGRNYKMNAFLVATAEEGELSPSLRRRSRRIYGRLVAEGDIARVRKSNKAMANYLSNDIPRFSFVYWGSKFYGPTHINDTVKSTPEDYVVKNPAPAKAAGYNWDWLVWGVIVGFTIWTIFGYVF